MATESPFEVYDFWFGALDDSGASPSDKAERWFGGGLLFDIEIRRRFSDTHAAIVAGACDAWLLTARGTLSWIVVLDQFSRNMFRDTPGMFEHDARCCAEARAALEDGRTSELRGHERVFAIMPLMHSENLAEQDLCLDALRALSEESDAAFAPHVAQNIKYGQAHRDIIERFGRFPHRNEILGRESTPDEVTFLAGPNSSF